jgi:hypothetical protein
LTGDLRASRQSAKQKVAGAGARTGTPNSLVRLGLVDGTSKIDGARYRHICLAAFGTDCDFRGIWIVAVLLFQRFLKGSNIHGNLIYCCCTREPRSRPGMAF